MVEENLKKCLSLFDVIVYGVGLILGAGIYVLIGEAAGLAGNTLWISFILAAIISAFTALSYAELSALFPRAAAEFVFIKNAFNNDFLALIIGFIALHIHTLDLAEIRSLVVKKEYRKLGIAKILIQKAIEEAKVINLKSYWY